MEQMELFNEVRQLHVWSDAERAERIKNPRRDRLGNAVGESPQTRTEETDKTVCRRIRRLSSGDTHDHASPSGVCQGHTPPVSRVFPQGGR